MDMLLEAAFWVALSQIMVVNIVLSGDNAVVIALACRNLPVRYRQPAILAGSAGAIALRVVFCVLVAWLLQISYLKIAGALLLFWIGVKLITEDEDEGSEGGVAGKANLWGAIQTIIIADAVMSLDNAIAIAAAAEQAAKGDSFRAWTLIVIGLLITIPIIILGSQLIMRIMQRYPIVILIGGALLGFVAGEMLITDKVLLGDERRTGDLRPWFEGQLALWFAPTAQSGTEEHAKWMNDAIHYVELGCGLFGALLTIVLGRWLLARAAKRRAVDLMHAAAAAESESAAGAGEWTMKGDILVAVDGSENSDRAARYAVELLKAGGGKLHLLNVQPALTGDTRAFVSKSDIESFRREEGEKALASAARIAAEAKVPAVKHISVGLPGEVAAEFARRLGAAMVVMGTRGHTGLAGVLLGSVAQDVVAHSGVPVCLVK
jgi:YjbE family integral membrane protein